MTCYFILPDLCAGGAERVAITLARILKEEGYAVKFVCLGGEQGEMRTWLIPEFEVEFLHCRRVLLAIPKLKRLFANRSDAILFSSTEHTSIATLLTGKRLGLPVIVRMPTMPKNKLYSGFIWQKWRVIHVVSRWLLPYAKKVIAQTDTMRQQILQYYHLPEDKVLTINNPIDKAFIRSSAEGHPCPFEGTGPHYLTVGNISYAKSIETLVEAFKKVKEHTPSARLTIVGRNDSDYARNLLSHLDIDESINLVGFKENPYPYMKHCDVFVLSSRMEGFPNVLLEAMCFNKPIACTTCVPIIKKLVQPGVNGYYCATESPDELAQCMLDAAGLTDIHNNYDLFDKNSFTQLFQ